MSSTLDNICDNINLKFSTLVNMLNAYKDISDGSDLIDESIQELNALHNNYITDTIELLNNYYTTTDDAELKTIRNQFIKTYHSCNIVGDMDRIYNNCKKMTYYLSLKNFRKLL